MKRSAKCVIPGCEKLARSRGWCGMHYMRWFQHGDPNFVVFVRIDGTRAERFWPKVNKTESCWLWTAARHRSGYGSFRDGNRTAEAHRVAYELLVGPIPHGLTLDHLCRIRHCVNPEHLEPVTNKENQARGNGIAAQRSRATACPNGHVYTPETTGHNKRGRYCIPCRKAILRRYYHRHHSLATYEVGSVTSE